MGCMKPGRLVLRGALVGRVYAGPWSVGCTSALVGYLAGQFGLWVCMRATVGNTSVRAEVAHAKGRTVSQVGVDSLQ